MVAVTVILAAVIAAFVFGMASGITKTKAVAATARQVNSSSIVVTWVGGPDNAMVTGWNVTVQPSTGGTVLWNTTSNLVGNSAIMGGGTSGQDHVIVVGNFNDGLSQVVLDTYV